MGWGPPHLVSIFLVLLKVDEITSVLCSQCPFTPEPPHVNECPETCEGDVCYIVVNKFFNGTISAGCLNLRSGDHFGGENVCHREETRTICGCEGAARCNDPQTPLAAYKFVDEPVFSRDQPIPPLQSDEATVKPMLVTGTSEEQLIEVKSSMFVKSTDGVTGTPTFKPHSSTTNDITQLADLGKHLPSTAPSDILPALLLDNSTNAPETSDIVEIEENTTNPSNFAVVLSTVATAPTTVIEQEAENVPHLKPFPEANFSTLPHEAVNLADTFDTLTQENRSELILSNESSLKTTKSSKLEMSLMTLISQFTTVPGNALTTSLPNFENTGNQSLSEPVDGSALIGKNISITPIMETFENMNESKINENVEAENSTKSVEQLGHPENQSTIEPLPSLDSSSIPFETAHPESLAETLKAENVTEQSLVTVLDTLSSNSQAHDIKLLNDTETSALAQEAENKSLSENLNPQNTTELPEVINFSTIRNLVSSSRSQDDHFDEITTGSSSSSSREIESTENEKTAVTPVTPVIPVARKGHQIELTVNAYLETSNQTGTISTIEIKRTVSKVGNETEDLSSNGKTTSLKQSFGMSNETNSLKEMDNGKTMETKQTKQTSISIASNQLIDLKPPPPNTTLPPMEQSSPVIISKSTWNSIEIDRERKPSTSPGLDKETAPENGSSQGWGSVEEIESEHTRAPKANEPQRAGLNSAESGDEQAKGVASPQEGTTGGSPQTTVVFSILTIFLTTYLKL